MDMVGSIGPHINPYLYDQIQAVTSEKEIYPSDIFHFTSSEEASGLVREITAWHSFRAPRRGGSREMALRFDLSRKIGSDS